MTLLVKAAFPERMQRRYFVLRLGVVFAHV